MQLIDVDIRDMERGIEGVLRRAETRSRTFFEGMRAPARGELKRHQKERRGPDGEPWPSQARERDGRGRFVAGKRRRGSRAPLGKLPGAYRWSADRDGLVGEHRVPWGSAHHEGAVVGHGARLPARPFAGFSADFSDEVREAWLSWTQRGW